MRKWCRGAYGHWLRPANSDLGVMMEAHTQSWQRTGPAGTAQLKRHGGGGVKVRSLEKEGRGGARGGTGGQLQPVLMRPTPQLSFKTWGGGGGQLGGGPAGGRGGVWPGVGGGSGRGSGGGSSRGSGGVQPGVRGGGLGLGFRLGLGSPSWWNQSWFYNPF